MRTSVRCRLRRRREAPCARPARATDRRPRRVARTRSDADARPSAIDQKRRLEVAVARRRSQQLGVRRAAAMRSRMNVYVAGSRRSRADDRARRSASAATAGPTAPRAARPRNGQRRDRGSEGPGSSRIGQRPTSRRTSTRYGIDDRERRRSPCRRARAGRPTTRARPRRPTPTSTIGVPITQSRGRRTAPTPSSLHAGIGTAVARAVDRARVVRRRRAPRSTERGATGTRRARRAGAAAPSTYQPTRSRSRDEHVRRRARRATIPVSYSMSTASADEHARRRSAPTRGRPASLDRDHAPNASSAARLVRVEIDARAAASSCPRPISERDRERDVARRANRSATRNINATSATNGTIDDQSVCHHSPRLPSHARAPPTPRRPRGRPGTRAPRAAAGPAPCRSAGGRCRSRGRRRAVAVRREVDRVVLGDAAVRL